MRCGGSSFANSSLQTTINAGRPRPPPLTFIPHDNKQLDLGPSSASYSNALANVTSSLHMTFNGMLRSPGPAGVACIGATAVEKPLPGRPRSMSLPSISGFPIELPGSILLENQGFPAGATGEIRPISQNIRRETHPPDGPIRGLETSDDIDLPPRKLPHISSLLITDHKVAAMRSVRSANALSAQANSQKVQQKTSLADVSSRRRSRQDLLNSSSVTDKKSSTCSTSTTEENCPRLTKDNFSARASLQPSSSASKERQAKSCVGKYSNRRSEVCCDCFFILVCRFVKQNHA